MYITYIQSKLGPKPSILVPDPPSRLKQNYGFGDASQEGQLCCVTKQTCLLSHTADMSPVSHSRHVCRVAQQTCLLCHTADMSAVSHSRHACCVTQQTCLLYHTGDMSAVSHNWIIPKSNYFFSAFCQQPRPGTAPEAPGRPSLLTAADESFEY